MACDIANCSEEVAGQEPAITTVCDRDAGIYMYHHLPQTKPGCKGIFESHPELVNIHVHVVTEYVKNHGFSAQNRHRSTIGNTLGALLANISEHVMMCILREKGISRTTVHQLLVAPGKSTINAARYHGLVKAPGLGTWK